MDGLARLQQALHEETDHALEAVFAEAEARAGKPYACRSGCSACCHQSVLCTASEAVLIADYLCATLSQPALEDTLRMLEEQSNAATGLGFFEYSRRKIACAFLDKKGACSIYPVRPMACRALKSFSVVACERVPESPSDLGSHGIPGSGPGLRAAKSLGVRHYLALADQAGIEPADFTLVLPRAVGLALAAVRKDEMPAFTPARWRE